MCCGSEDERKKTCLLVYGGRLWTSAEPAMTDTRIPCSSPRDHEGREEEGLAPVGDVTRSRTQLRRRDEIRLAGCETL